MFHKYNIITLSFFLSFYYCSFSQNTTKAKELILKAEDYINTDIDSAIYCLDKAISLIDTNINREILSSAYSGYGELYNIKGNYSLAINYYNKALLIDQKKEDDSRIAADFNNIGNIYLITHEYDLANEFFNKSLEIKYKLNNKIAIGNTLLSIANLHFVKNNLDKALENTLKAKDIFDSIKHFEGLILSYTSLGNISNQNNDYFLALKYYFLALDISLNKKDYYNECIIYINIGDVYFYLKDYNKSIENYEKSLGLAEKIDFLQGLGNSFEKLYLSYEALQQHEYALMYYKLFTPIKDSLNRKENSDAILRNSLEYKFQKKQEAKDIIAKQKQKTNQIIILIFIIVIGALIIIALLIYKSFTEKRTSNKNLKNKNETIQIQLSEIKDSIRYAKRIQTAILPSNKQVKEELSNSFIIYLPKDVVAGDFYWINRFENKLYFAVADCTGHGVPGAMMSVIGNHALNSSIKDYNLSDTNLILSRCRELMIQEFDNSETNIQDGMDIAICCLENNKLSFSGANRPLWIIRNNKLIIIDGDRLTIGNINRETPFKKHDILLEENDIIYMFSDGIVDQFGGEKRKKFKKQRLKELLLKVSDLPLNEQYETILNNFNLWKGEQEQLDDVCLMGIRI
jgi:serine phosphatase RsbU (regulator of sigma subunit)